MALPIWLTDLRESNALPSWSWLGEAEGARIRGEWLDIWSQVKFEERFHALCTTRLARCIPVATGPSRERRLSKTASRLTLVFDPEHEDMVCVSHSHAIPSACWSMGPPTDIDRLLAPYVEPPAVRTPDARSLRVVKSLDVEDVAAVGRAIDVQELWIDDAFWGSRYTEDPWAAAFRDMNMLSLSVAVQRFSEQAPGRFPTVGCRTLWSQSTLRIEQHPRGLFAFDMHFEPAHDAQTIDTLSSSVGARLPSDLPVDLAAALLRGATVTHEDVERMERQGAPPFQTLALRCALAPASPETYNRLRSAIASHRDDDMVLGGVASLASQYHHDGLLFEIAACAPAPLSEELRAFLHPPTEPTP